MQLEEALLMEHSKANTNRVIEWVGDDPKRFEQLIRIVLDGTKDQYRLIQRASWPLGHIGEQHPYLLKNYIPEIIERLKKPGHPSVHRNLIRSLQYLDIPEEHQGPLVDISFNFLTSRQTPVAIRVFSMTLLGNIIQSFPELVDELAETIRTYYPHESPGFKSRARKVMKQLGKTI